MSKSTNIPKLGAAMREVADRIEIKVERLAAAFLCGESRMYDAISNDAWDQRYATIRHALASLPAPMAEAVIRCLIPSDVYEMPVRLTSIAPNEIDADGNGVVDAGDTLIHAAEATCRISESIAAVAHKGRNGNEADKAAARATMQEALEKIQLALAALDNDGMKLPRRAM